MGHPQAPTSDLRSNRISLQAPNYIYDATRNRYFRRPPSGEIFRQSDVLAGATGVRVTNADVMKSPRPKRNRPMRLLDFFHSVETGENRGTHAEFLAASILGAPSCKVNFSELFLPIPREPRSSQGSPSHCYLDIIWPSVRGRRICRGTQKHLFADPDFLPSPTDHIFGGPACFREPKFLRVLDSSNIRVGIIRDRHRGCSAIALCGSTHPAAPVLNPLRIAKALEVLSQFEVVDVYNLNGLESPLRVRKSWLSSKIRSRSCITSVRWVVPPASGAVQSNSVTALVAAGSRSGSILLWDLRASNLPIISPDRAFGQGGLVSDIRGCGNLLYVSRCSRTGSHEPTALAAWDFRMPDGVPCLRFQEHVNDYRHLYFDVWNGVLAGGGSDNKVRLWDSSRGGEPLARIDVDDIPLNVRLGDVDSNGIWVGGLRIDSLSTHTFHAPGKNCRNSTFTSRVV